MIDYQCYSSIAEPICKEGVHFCIAGLEPVATKAISYYAEEHGCILDDEPGEETAFLIFRKGYPGHGEKTIKYQLAKERKIPCITVLQFRLKEGFVHDFASLSSEDRLELAGAWLLGVGDFPQSWVNELKRIVQNKSRVFRSLCMQEANPEAMIRFLDLCPPQESRGIDQLIHTASEQGKTEFAAAMLAWRKRKEPTGEEDDLFRDLSLEEELSEKQWRAEYCFEILPKGINVSAWLGEGNQLVIPGYILGKRVISVGGRSIGHRKDVRVIRLPASVRTIQPHAFSSCTALECFSAGRGLREIGKSAFQGCTSLKEFHVPEGVTEIGDCAFWGCSKLTAVYFSDSLTGIGKNCFYACPGIRFYCPEGSLAYEYAHANGIPCEVTE